jgi:hypothetical protein
MLRDRVILSRQGHISVLAERHTVAWTDAESIDLHAVLWGGDRSTFQRALPYGGQWLIFDLRDVCPSSLEREAQAMRGNDALGLSIYALRRYHTSVRTFLQTVAQFVRVGWPMEDGVRGHSGAQPAMPAIGSAFAPTTAGVFYAAR